jgi:uncharacterized repeat protein (TIGR03803 family)
MIRQEMIRQELIRQELRSGRFRWFTVMACAILFVSAAFAQTEKVLYSFTGGTDGSQPDAGLTPDGAGNYYGSTFFGGEYGWGVIYKLSHASSGWTETVLYNFQGGSEDGASPAGTLILDSAGNIYGITVAGGKGYGIQEEPGYGIAFELSPSGSGWTETIIHFFDNTDGGPSSGFIRDAAGNLYGETGGGNASGNNGTVYLMRSTPDGWEYGILYRFQGGNDGDYPYGGLIFDAKGNLYGTTIEGGGTAGDGTVFELERGTSGGWTEKQLYAFQNTADGVAPQAPVVFDKAGNLYGTTVWGGDACSPYGCGLVFELSPSGDTWTKSTLYTFTGEPNGHAPSAGLSFDKAGDIFGTTSNGGSNDSGALFELKPQSGGGWQESIVESFTDGSNGGYPSTPLIVSGTNIYGTAGSGGQYGHGIVFEMSNAASEQSE